VNFDDLADESTGEKFWKLNKSLLQQTMIIRSSGVNATRLSSFIGNISSDRIILVTEKLTTKGNHRLGT
jgi:hypothetical protein